MTLIKRDKNDVHIPTSLNELDVRLLINQDATRSDLANVTVQSKMTNKSEPNAKLELNTVHMHTS